MGVFQAQAGPEHSATGATGATGRTYGQQGYYRPSPTEVKFSALKNAYDLLAVKENATIGTN